MFYQLFVKELDLVLC